MSEPLLQGRTAIITGAGAGIGRGTALAMAAAGANVVIAARRAVTGDETAALIAAEGGTALAVQCDVTQPADIARTVEATIARFGGIDILVHNANSGLSGIAARLEEVDDARWDEQAAIALDAAFLLAQATLPHLRAHGRGRFIILSSAQGLHGGSMNPVYAAVKHAQRGMMKALAREWGPLGITVNAVAPASMTEAADRHFERNPQLKNWTLAQICLRRLGDPRLDIGQAMVALASDHMSYVTGQTIPVDGGAYTAL